MSNFYDLLKVDARASTEDIKKAFRQRAKDLHPDANPAGGPELHKEFLEVSEAYEVILFGIAAWHYRPSCDAG